MTQDILNKIMRRYRELGSTDVDTCHVSYENFSKLYKDLAPLHRDEGVQQIVVYLTRRVNIEPRKELDNDQFIFTRDSEDIKRILHTKEFGDKIDKLIEGLT